MSKDVITTNELTGDAFEIGAVTVLTIDVDVLVITLSDVDRKNFVMSVCNLLFWL